MYRVKRGEQFGNFSLLIDNEEAARLLLAFDLDEPWSSHQTYALFDNRYSAIFGRPEVDAYRILMLTDFLSAIEACLKEDEAHEISRYQLSRYFVLYLLKCVLVEDELGQELYLNPKAFMGDDNLRGRLKGVVPRVVSDICGDLKTELRDRKEEGSVFEIKSDLKSATAAKELAKQVVAFYAKQVRRRPIFSFRAQWQDSEDGNATPVSG